MGSRGSTKNSPARLTLAWGVHLLTASGAVVGMVSIMAILAGNLPRAALLMMLALAIDSIDGTLARKARVKQLLPRVDGRRLDDIVDFLNFVIVPVVFMVASGHLGSWVWAGIPILASAYGFSQQDAKTDDDFFRGWPSYWNIVALYAWMLDLSVLSGTLWTVGLSIAIFIPIKYVYPSRARSLKRTTNALGIGWGILISLAIAFPPLEQNFHLTAVSLFFPVYYVGLSFWLGGLQERARAFRAARG